MTWEFSGNVFHPRVACDDDNETIQADSEFFWVSSNQSGGRLIQIPIEVVAEMLRRVGWEVKEPP